MSEIIALLHSRSTLSSPRAGMGVRKFLRAALQGIKGILRRSPCFRGPEAVQVCLQTSCMSGALCSCRLDKLMARTVHPPVGGGSSLGSCGCEKMSDGYMWSVESDLGAIRVRGAAHAGRHLVSVLCCGALAGWAQALQGFQACLLCLKSPWVPIRL